MKMMARSGHRGFIESRLDLYETRRKAKQAEEEERALMIPMRARIGRKAGKEAKVSKGNMAYRLLPVDKRKPGT